MVVIIGVLIGGIFVVELRLLLIERIGWVIAPVILCHLLLHPRYRPIILYSSVVYCACKVEFEFVPFRKILTGQK